MNARKKSLLMFTFALYGLMMVWLLFGQRMEGWVAEYSTDALMSRINLIPFKTIFDQTADLFSPSNSHAMINLLGNVIMFVPMGFFIPAIFLKKSSFGRTALWSVVTVTCIEIIQLVTLLGSLDIDDLILNLLGAAIGFWIYKLFARFMKGESHE